jgi:hypothetical protein
VKPQRYRALDVLRGIPPKRWWVRKSPKKARNCYKSKADALRAFLDWNLAFIDEAAGGESYKHGCSEFDSINRTYQVPRKRCVRTVAEAVWYALRGRGPGGQSPFCIQDIDLATLNRTTPGAKGRGFQLPPRVQEETLDEEQERYWREVAYESGRSDCFITWRKGHGYFARESPRARGRQLQCVCRTRRGRFMKCPEPPDVEEVPF